MISLFSLFLIKQENLLDGKDGCTGRLETATVTDILYLFRWSEVNFIILSGKNQESLKTDV